MTEQEAKERMQKAMRASKGRMIKILNDTELHFTVDMLNAIAELYEDGCEPEVISNITNRDVDEIFLALFHLARNSEITRPLGVRISGKHEDLEKERHFLLKK